MDVFRVNPFAAEHHSLLTRLTPAECTERLSAHTFKAGTLDGYRALLSTQRYPVYGSVSERSFALSRLVSLRYPVDVLLHTDALQIQARGRFISSESGTVLPVLISLHPAMAVLLLIFGGFLAGIAALAIQGFLPAFVPVVFFVLWGGAYILMLRQARDAGKFLLHFLHETLKAEEESGTSAAG